MDTLKKALSARFHDALQFASGLHARQARKKIDPAEQRKIPYISHLLAVCSIVLEAGGSEDEAIAAILHDAAEDQGGEEILRVIADRYGTGVANIVAHCSDTFKKPKPPWQRRKREYIKSLAGAGKSTLLVSAADKLHNAQATLRDLKRHGSKTWKLFNAPEGKKHVLWYYDALISAHRSAESSSKDPRRTAIVDELAETVDEMR